LSSQLVLSERVRIIDSDSCPEGRVRKDEVEFPERRKSLGFRRPKHGVFQGIGLGDAA
jgi:hypothetical protein